MVQVAEMKLIELVDVVAKNGVQQNSIAMNEMDVAHLSCFTTSSEKVAWSVETILDPKDDYDSIYAVAGLDDSYLKTGRYSVNENGGWYNLTIASIDITEAGRYRCSEEAGLGPHTYIDLHVFGQWGVLLLVIALSFSHVLIHVFKNENSYSNRLCLKSLLMVHALHHWRDLQTWSLTYIPGMTGRSE
jgi:hypothetical protein